MATKKQQDIASMSDADLMKAWTSLADQVTEDRERLREFSREHQSRTAQDNLEARFGDMNEQERAALAQFAAAGGVSSEEKGMGDN